MKRIIFYSMIYFLLFGCSNLVGKNNDPKHPAFLVGTWINTDSTDQSVLILGDNGRYDYSYTEGCDTKKCSDAGTWEIKDSVVDGKKESYFYTADNGHPYCSVFEFLTEDGDDFLTLKDEEPPILKFKRKKK